MYKNKKLKWVFYLFWFQVFVVQVNTLAFSSSIIFCICSKLRFVSAWLLSQSNISIQVQTTEMIIQKSAKNATTFTAIFFFIFYFNLSKIVESSEMSMLFSSISFWFMVIDLILSASKIILMVFSLFSNFK